MKQRGEHHRTAMDAHERSAVQVRELNCSATMASKPEDVRVRYAVSLIDQHHSDPPTVRDLAKAVNVSPSHLTRLFREHTGRSPKQFGRDVRLERACVLVMTTFMSIKEVM